MDREDWQGPRSALIIAADRYDDPALARLRAPSRDARELRSILADQSIGNYQVTQILNRPAQDVREAIESFFADAGNRHTLLLYLSCHGIKNERNQLRFATTSTKVGRLESTSIPAEFVAEQMERSRSRRIAVLLDCCYSGAFPSGLRARSGDEVSLDPLWAAAPQGRGRVVISSSRATEYAFEKRTDGRVSERLLTRAEPSVFTDAVVAGLRSGQADHDGDGWVTVQELYDYVHDRVHERAPHQTPQLHGGIEGRFTIARNPAAGTAPGTGPASPEPRRRRVKVILGAAALLAAGTAVTIWLLIGPGGTGGVRIPLTVNTCAGVARVPTAAVRLGTLPTGRPGITQGNNNDYVGATFASDCHLMAAAGNGQERILNLAAGLQTAILPVNRGHWVFGAAFTPDGKTLAVASNDGVTELWDATSGEQLASLPTDPNGSTWGLALSPDGNTLVTGGSDRLVEFWDVATHTQIRKISVPGIGSLAISPNGKLVAVGGASDGIERLLSLPNGAQLSALNSHAGNAFSVAFSPDSRTLAVATGSGVQWWDISSGKLSAQEPALRMTSPSARTARFWRSAATTGWSCGTQAPIGPSTPCLSDRLGSGSPAWHSAAMVAC